MSGVSSRGTTWDKVRITVLNRDGWVCTYCNKALIGDDATVDHIIAKANGGTDDPWNLTSACRSCNSSKKDRVVARLNYNNPKWC